MVPEKLENSCGVQSEPVCGSTDSNPDSNGIEFRSAGRIPYPIRNSLFPALSVLSVPFLEASPAWQSKLALWGPPFWAQLPESWFALGLCWVILFWQLNGLSAHSAVLSWALSSSFFL